MALIPSLMAGYIVRCHPITKVVSPSLIYSWERFLFPLIQLNLNIVRLLVSFYILLVVRLNSMHKLVSAENAPYVVLAEMAGLSNLQIGMNVFM